MQINNDLLKKLSAMSNDDFKKFISSAAAENEIDLPAISSADIEKIRAMLGSIDPNDPTISRAIGEISKSDAPDKRKHK